MMIIRISLYSNIFIILVCVKAPIVYSFVPKCCPQGQAFSPGCTMTNNSLVNPFIPSNNATVRYHPLHCGESGSFYLNPDDFPDSDEYYLLQNSSLYLVGSKELLNSSRYCIDLILPINKVRPLLCFKDDTCDGSTDSGFQDDTKALRIYSYGMIFSLPFLFVTFVVYASIKTLRTLHGRCLCNHVSSLFFGYVLLIFLQRHTAWLISAVCIGLGFSVQYFFLATFFWLNVMCIDIYWAFSSVRSIGGRSSGDINKLILYSIYAWGMPLIILLITIWVDFSDIIPDTSPFKPKVGTNKCFFDGRTSSYVYFYGPMAVLLFVNLILFGITAYRIWSASKETANLNRGDSRRHSNKQDNERFKLYMKLFLVMGINWLAELISFILGEQVPHYLWYVTDLTNTLQGVFIFIIFVWKRRVRRLVYDRVCMLTGGVVGGTNSKRLSRMRRGGTSSDATTTTTTINNTAAVSQLRLNSVGLVK